MHPSAERIETLKQAVITASNNPNFIHHPWFVTYHLEIVAGLANELLAFYPDANPELVEVLAWIHDYGKALDFDRQYEMTLSEGPKLLQKLGFEPEFTKTVIDYMEIMDKKLELDIHTAPLEVQIVSSADGCSHLAGPFMPLWWWENAGKPFEELMVDNIRKAEKDWNHKVVLPEARRAFAQRHRFLLEQMGRLPEKYLS